MKWTRNEIQLLHAPQVFSLGKELPAEMVAEALCLSASEIVTDIHSPIVASVGLPFLMVELRDPSVLQKAGINPIGFERIADQGVEMGRPSLLQARSEKTADKVLSTWIGGSCVLVSEGHIYID